MSLLTKNRDSSRAWRTSGPSPGPGMSAETFDRRRAHLDHPANAIRARGLLGTELRYIAHPSFDDPDARDAILAATPAPAGVPASRRTKAADGLPSYLVRVCDEGPLLSREQEAHLFRKMNYLKHRACRLRDRIDPDRPRAEDLDEVERFLDGARAIRNQIVRANLRLVLSIVKQRCGPCDDFFERVSDGNYVMIRAVERFDFALGNKFSTYATWAIRNNLARDSQRRNSRPHRNLQGLDEAAVDRETDDLEQLDLQEQRRDAVARSLARLDDRERQIIVDRFGIGGARVRTLKQIGEELGITKERVRQIEARAQGKLRRLARLDEPVLLQA